MPSHMTIILCQRDHFDIPRNIAYFNCGYMAPIHDAVAAALADGAAIKRRPWMCKPADFFRHTEDFRSRAAALTGLPADDIAIVPAASYGLAVAANNLPLAKRQSIVLLHDQFPSNVYPWRRLAERNDGRIVTARRDADGGWTDAVLAAIDTDTAIVAVPQIHWADGIVLDLVAISQKCRSVGAALVLDLTQSLGAMPVDLAAIRPDFMVAACYKWLLGPYGLGMLYVSPQHQDGIPLEDNWINRAGSEDFARLVDYRDDFQPGARRFDMGEKSNPPLLMAGGAALDLLTGWGVESITATLGEKTDAIEAALSPLGFTAAPRALRSSHMLSLAMDGGDPSALAGRLAEAGVYLSVRGTSLRITPHLYNDEGDVARLVGALGG